MKCIGAIFSVIALLILSHDICAMWDSVDGQRLTEIECELEQLNPFRIVPEESPDVEQWLAERKAQREQIVREGEVRFRRLDYLKNALAAYGEKPELLQSNWIRQRYDRLQEEKTLLERGYREMIPLFDKLTFWGRSLYRGSRNFVADAQKLLHERHERYVQLQDYYQREYNRLYANAERAAIDLSEDEYRSYEVAWLRRTYEKKRNYIAVLESASTRDQNKISKARKKARKLAWTVLAAESRDEVLAHTLKDTLGDLRKLEAIRPEMIECARDATILERLLEDVR